MGEFSPNCFSSELSFSQVTENARRKPAASSCERHVPVRRVPFPRSDRQAIYSAWLNLGKSVRWLAKTNAVSEATIENIIRECIRERDSKLTGDRALLALRAGVA